ncbi:MAG: methionine adenosyltransferase [Paludibacteraceae bacterium]|nr:methionine adenosyltransferase [Paludibacteraceae bacterium]
MAYLFTSESVSEGHPDKVADQISDAILDNFLANDPQSHVACETLVTTGQVVLAGEVTSNCYIDVNQIVRKVIADIGYTKSEYKFEAESCGIFTALHEQSSDINMGVSRAVAENQGAGDQGMMFGYATDETDNFMPLTLDIAHTLVYTLARIRKEGKQMRYLRPDSKSQVTIEYDDEGRALRIDTIVLSTQHDPDVSQEQIRKDVQEILIPRVLSRDSRYAELFGKSDYKLLVNPTGQFVIGGPHGDTGLTGRKIIVDTYGGRGAHGGGAFSGKDPSKVDRSAAYMARYMAKNLVAAGVAHEALVQISYAIGVAEPVSLNVNTNGTAMVKMSDGEIAKKLGELFDLRPYAIEQTLHLREPIYTESASYGYVGRTPQVVEKTFVDGNGKPFTKKVKLFSWEELDRVNDIKKRFGIL